MTESDPETAPRNTGTDTTVPLRDGDEGDSSVFSSIERQSFRNTMRTVLGILRILAAVLGLVFLFSNVYMIPEGMVAVHYRLGAPLGRHPEDAVRFPGGPYFAFPFPIDKIERFPTTMQQLKIANAFLSESGDPVRNIKQEVNPASLKPGINGSLITADKNIVQGTWGVSYRIDCGSPESRHEVIDFINGIGSIDSCNTFIRILAEEAIVMEVALTPVQDFVTGRINHVRMKHSLQRRIDSLRIGIRISTVTALTNVPPQILKADFQAVTQSESEKALMIEKAVRYKISTLSETAGDRWEELLQLLDSCELYTGNGDTAVRGELFARVETIMRSGMLGGRVALQIDRALTDKTGTIEKTRAAVNRFIKLQPLYAASPSITRARLKQDVRAKLFGAPDAKIQQFPPETKLLFNYENLKKQVKER